jgi:Flp pilus assembly protein TadB
MSAANSPTLSVATGSVSSTPALVRSAATLIPAKYRRQLTDAGIVEPQAQTNFLVLHALAVTVGALAAVWLVLGKQPSIATWLPALAMGALAGWWLPRSWLEWKQTQRRIEIVSDFPVMLDLLQISLQGGMGLPAAWDVVAFNLSGTGDAMAQEMRRVAFEVNFGTTWSQSLSTASERTGVPDFRSLGSLLQQTERFGTELSQAIQVLSDSLRNEEIESIEERAHRASVLMLVPIGVLLLPSTLLLILVPMFTMLLETLQDANNT